MTVLTEADQISDIAFGFMGSKALFAALGAGVFTHLDDGPLSCAELATLCPLDEIRTEILLTALAGLGLVEGENGKFKNSPAAESFLVKGAKYDFGDYLRLQVGQQMYGLLDQIDDALQDKLPDEATASYAEWFSDPEEAKIYSASQHSGSLGPARQLARKIDLSDARHLLDVGGGTGAFAITLCKAFPNLTATIVDFPNVAILGREYVARAGLSDRISYVEGNALETEWPGGQDVVLMSYLFSGVPGEAHDGLLGRARDQLKPGGRFLLHDFVVREDRTGPKLAALWQLQHTAFTPRARSLDEGWLRTSLDKAGFEDISVDVMIPEMTMLASAVKPA
ncbi:Demethylspheroidene O-methyltransferase [Thalassovita gelatinovora]|uniref:Demethylspheroidene O-methyltransferase n=1 Tax=Thalassovita gelatinovora TaxID=53501 RepID=A0A0P1F5Q6_THAGE|nr:methyltransferase [Thalassovita gelatinovora]QIZ79440.1 methyltransferase [Thalassovita gelatinovora]CUH62806.1 Demethylspheroidene O-methyltransferase [Thalassovita gelatinovora]SEQ10503.1 Dimerisation domain-containing protein [Thalassovita gelatinovora]